MASRRIMTCSHNQYHSHSYMSVKAMQDVSRIRQFVPCRKSYMAVFDKDMRSKFRLCKEDQQLSRQQHQLCFRGVSADQTIMWLFWCELQFSKTCGFQQNSAVDISARTHPNIFSTAKLRTHKNGDLVRKVYKVRHVE